MNLLEVMKTLEKWKFCEVITSWKEIPIRVRMAIRWVSTRDKFVSFDFKDGKFRMAFSSENPVYIKVGETYLLSKVFSNLRDELVLEVERIVPPPPITMRESIRVQPSDKEPVFISICLDEGYVIKAAAKDVSETGIGTILKKEDADRFLGLIAQDTTEHLINKEIKITIELPGGYAFEADAEFRNIFTESEGLYVRVGFRIRPKGKDLQHLRSYIMRRQRELIEQWRSL